MKQPKIHAGVDTIIPGVSAAYAALLADNGMGIYTSNGAFYNHTLFGRDAAMSAKFVADFDHETAKETIIALAALQGKTDNPITQEEPGRIHHELRDLSTWKGTLLEKLIFQFFRVKWGADGKQLLTYFSVDSTASFIRLVNKYAHKVDRSLLDTTFVDAYGERTDIAASVARAADWIVDQIDSHDHFIQIRTNKWSLPYQTFQDSVTAFPRIDGHLMNFKQPLSLVEMHMFAADALEDVSKLLSEHPNRHQWQDAAHRLRESFITDFWQNDSRYFAAAIDTAGQSDMHMINAGWTLNTSLWDEIPKTERQMYITGIVEMLFSDGFLTNVGLRTRSISQQQPLESVIEYHGAGSVWPMFTFMVIEGLRRHGMHRLAEQLENRLINGINMTGNFDEFLAVQKDGTILLPAQDQVKPTLHVDAQMIPEHQIAFTIVPAMVIAHRVVMGEKNSILPEDWQLELEKKILDEIPHVERVAPQLARSVVGPVVTTEFHRWRGNAKTIQYYRNELRRMR